MSFKRIDAASLRQMLAEQPVVIADIRDDASFEAAHIEGAIQLGNHNFSEFLQSSSETDSVVVVCYHGISSQPVAGFLVEQGYSDVYSLDGGYEAWASLQN